jgi:hypothetical protein
MCVRTRAATLNASPKGAAEELTDATAVEELPAFDPGEFDR